MFHQRFETVSHFIRECHEKRGLSTALFHFVLQEQDHEILDECVRILLRTGRWDTSQKNKITNYAIPAQYPFQDEAFALALGINQGFKPSSPEYPLCLFFQHGNPLMLEIHHIIRSNHITTVDQYDALIAASPIRSLHKTLLTTMSKHHYSKVEIDLILYAEFLCQVLTHEGESFHHWCKIDSSDESVLSEFSDLYPQFHELQLNKLSRYRILTAIWSLPHPRLFALISANRADSILNRTQLLILLEKRHLPHLLSFLYTITLHLDNAKKQAGYGEVENRSSESQEGPVVESTLTKLVSGRINAPISTDLAASSNSNTLSSSGPTDEAKVTPLMDYLEYTKQVYWVELDPTLGVTPLLPQNYLTSFNAGCNSNPLNGGQVVFGSYKEEIEYLESALFALRELFTVIWFQYSWLDFPSSLQVAIIILLQYAPHVLSFLPWVPHLNGKNDLISSFDKFIVDHMTILRYDQQERSSLTTQIDQSGEDPTTNATQPSTTTPFDFTYNDTIIQPYLPDMKQTLHDNRRWIMPVLNTDLYGSDIVVVAPEFKNELLSPRGDMLSTIGSLDNSGSTDTDPQMTRILSSSDSSSGLQTIKISDRISTFELIHSTATRTPSHLDELTISSPTAPTGARSDGLGASSQSLDFCQVEEGEEDDDSVDGQSKDGSTKANNASPESVENDGETTPPPTPTTPIIGTDTPEVETTDSVDPATSPESGHDVALVGDSEKGDVQQQSKQKKDSSETKNQSTVKKVSAIASSVASSMSSSSSSIDFLKSCLPLDQKNRRAKRHVKFLETIYQTNDERPMARGGKVLGHDDDLAKHDSYQSQFDTKLRSSMLRFALSFAVSANMTHVVDKIIEVSNGRSLNDLMAGEGSKAQQQQGYRSEPKSNFFDNLIAAACSIPHCHPSTIQYLFKKRSKLCTNNKTGRDNNAFLVLYQTNQHWLYQHHRYTKLLALWLQVKQNERVYKPHLDFNEFITATINQIFAQSSSYWSFVFFLEHLLSVAERTLIKQNAIRVCDILACLYNPPHSTNFSATSIIPNTTRFLGAPGSQQGLSRQNCSYPSDLTIGDLDLILPPIINYTEYTTTQQQQQLDDGVKGKGSMVNDLTQPVPSYTPQTLPHYTPIVSPPRETYLDPNTSIKDAYHQYECAQRRPYLHYFINSSTLGLFLPPSQEYVVTEEFPAELFTPSPTSSQTLGSEGDGGDEIEVEEDALSSSSATPATSTSTASHKGDDDEEPSHSTAIQLEAGAAPVVTFPQGGTKNKKNQDHAPTTPDLKKTLHPRSQPLNVQLFQKTQKTLAEVNRVSALLMRVNDPLGYCGGSGDDDSNTSNPNTHTTHTSQQSSLRDQIIHNYNSTPQSAAPASDETSLALTTTPATIPIAPPAPPAPPTLPSFLSGPNQFLANPRGSQRDNLQQLMFPFLEFRDLEAMRYLFDLGISTKSMWQRLLSLHHVFFDIKDIVEYIPSDLYTNRHNYSISGLKPTNLINENPWLVLGQELEDNIIAKKKNPSINPSNPTKIILHDPVPVITHKSKPTGIGNNNNDDDDDDVDYTNLPPLEDVATLIAKGINPEDLFGAGRHSASESQPPLVFESPNRNPFLSNQFLTGKHQSPMLQMLQLFLLYDNSLFEHSIPQGPRNLATTACLSFNWPIVQALYITNTDSFVPQSDLSKYQNAVYCYRDRIKPTDDIILPMQTGPDGDKIARIDVGPQGMGLTQAVNSHHSLADQHRKQIQSVFKEYHYDLDIAASYKHDLLAILGSNNNDVNTKSLPKIDLNDRALLDTIAPHVPPRVFNKLTNPFLAQIRNDAITPSFTPSFHVDYLHLLLMFLLPQRNLNPITNYFSMLSFELIFSHVLRDYLIFDTTQREELLIYLRRSLVVHSFLPQTEKSLYEGPVENIVKVVLQHSKDLLMRQARYKEQVFINSIKSLYKYHILFTTTRPKQSEYLFLFSQTHLLHPSLVYDTFHAFVKFGGNFQKALPVLQYSILEFFQQNITSSSSSASSSSALTTVGNEDDEAGPNDKFLHIVRQFFPKFALSTSPSPASTSGSE